MEIPKISVIIPLYNAEKYIGECLESILIQTFQDFEVIVVDDCSTDNSVEIVQNYAEKFGGRLKISRTQKNSGGGSFPRNKGAKLSRGDYLFFMDADDFFTETALEDMYFPAKKFDADVVYFESYISYENDGKEVKKVGGRPSTSPPVLEVGKQIQHLELFAADAFSWSPWTKFVKRSWLMENEIFFQELPRTQDFLWTLKIFAYSERFLRLSVPVYFYRDAPESITRIKRSDDKTMNSWMGPVVKGLKEIGDFMSGLELLKDKPALRYAIMDFFVSVHFARVFLQLSWQFQPHEVYENFKAEYGEELGKNDVLFSYFCAASNALLKFTMQSQNELRQLKGGE